MPKLLSSAIIAIACLLALPAAAQTDDENLANAFAALSQRHNCDDAMHYLNLISAASKEKAAFVLCMARTHDCKKNTEQAIYYYNKYLAIFPGTDSIMQRVAELKDRSARESKMEAETEATPSADHKPTRVIVKKKHRHMNLDDNYLSTGCSYGKMLGGNNAPYSSLFSLDLSEGFLIINQKAVLDVNFNSGFLLSPRNAWFANAVQLPGTNVGASGPGFAELITLGLNPVLFNHRSLTLTAGAVAGVGFYTIATSVNNTSASFNPDFSFCYGLKSNLYLGDNCMFFIQAILNAANSTTITGYSSDYSVPVSYNTLTAGVAFKFESWWW